MSVPWILEQLLQQGASVFEQYEDECIREREHQGNTGRTANCAGFAEGYAG